VVTAVDGLPEAVEALDPSLVVEPRSADALAARLAAAASGALPSRVEARSFAERFAWTGVAERNLDHARAALDARKTRTRVVYLDHVGRLSGGEIALLRLLPHLTQTTAHVILGEDGPLVVELRARGISVEVLPMPVRAREVRKHDVRLGRVRVWALIGSAYYVVRLSLRLRALRPDLVHTNSLKSGVYGALAGRLSRIPVVWHVRDRIAPDYLPAPAIKLVHRLIRTFATTVIANSQATLETLDRPVNGTVVYSVIPEVIGEAMRNSTAVRSGATTFTMVGRIAPWKGQDVFLEAFAQAFPNGDQRAVIVGDSMFGDEEHTFAAGLRARTRALGVADRVEFRGFCNDVWPELEHADVLVHASRSPEPFGQVVLEGMAAGLAVVATAAGGPAELITDGRNGLLYLAGDAEALARILRELDEDPARRCALGVAARARARDFLPSPIVEGLEALYVATLEAATRA
jgi:glycosyltransferase involved in cell wall biosynthesis